MSRSATTGPAPPQLATRLCLTAREAADALGVSEKTLWALTLGNQAKGQPSGTIPSFRIGHGQRSIRYSVAALEQWIAAEVNGQADGSLTAPPAGVD